MGLKTERYNHMYSRYLMHANTAAAVTTRSSKVYGEGQKQTDRNGEQYKDGVLAKKVADTVSELRALPEFALKLSMLEFFDDALETLARARHFLMHCYVYMYFLRDDHVATELFNKQQGMLENFAEQTHSLLELTGKGERFDQP